MLLWKYWGQLKNIPVKILKLCELSPKWAVWRGSPAVCGWTPGWWHCRVFLFRTEVFHSSVATGPLTSQFPSVCWHPWRLQCVDCLQEHWQEVQQVIFFFRHLKRKIDFLNTTARLQQDFVAERRENIKYKLHVNSKNCGKEVTIIHKVLCKVDSAVWWASKY